MVRTAMKNPLGHRHIRELRGDLGKYLVIFLLLVISIGEVSGFLVADGSMITAYNESFTAYNVEHGHFTTESAINRGTRRRIEDLGVTVYDLFHADVRLTGIIRGGGDGEAEEADNTLRIFAMRDEVNRVCLMDGGFPSAPGEIAIDRLYAENNGYRIGDTLVSGDRQWRIAGTVALSDYSTMFESNTDMMFDASQFGVGVIGADAFAEFPEDEVARTYAWRYPRDPASPEEENEKAENFMKNLSHEVALTEFTPRYMNKAIVFTGDDMGSDRSMMRVFLYLITVIIAFVFAVTISNTITKEAAVIGTLRASGYTKRELVIHYMTMPVLVTGVAAVIGNIMGYTLMKDLNANLYYHSYSLTKYVTLWNSEAFIETTVIPVAVMLVIDVAILLIKLSLPPLKFIRRDLSRRKNRRALPLPSVIPFFARFRIRVILQNIPNYLLLFTGILFANLLLMFGLGLPALLHHYEETMPQTMFADYQYILQFPAGAADEDEKIKSALTLMEFMRGVDTENPDAEKFSAYTLKTVPDGDMKSEDILLYGVGKDSRYIPIPLEKGDVYVSSTYAEKMYLTPGDKITLKEPYEDTEYTFEVTGIYEYSGSLCVFMPKEDLNEVFDLGEDTYTGYFSDTPITDIDEKYVGQVINMESLTKVSRQLMSSMGSMMYVLDAFAVIIFVTMVYLLSKIIIEKNAQSISMTKILGYLTGEIGKLYIAATTAAVFISMLITLPLCEKALHYLYETMIAREMTGWIPYIIEPVIYGKMVALGAVTYFIVALFEFKKIGRVPLDEALKNTE